MFIQWRYILYIWLILNVQCTLYMRVHDQENYREEQENIPVERVLTAL